MRTSPRFFWQNHYADPAKVVSALATIRTRQAEAKARGQRAASLTLFIQGAAFVVVGGFLLSLPIWVHTVATHSVATAGLVFVTMGAGFLAGGAGQIALRARRTKASLDAHEPWGRS